MAQLGFNFGPRGVLALLCAVQLLVYIDRGMQYASTVSEYPLLLVCDTFLCQATVLLISIVYRQQQSTYCRSCLAI